MINLEGGWVNIVGGLSFVRPSQLYPPFAFLINI